VTSHVNTEEEPQTFDYFLKLLTEKKLEKEKNRVLTDWDLLTPAQQLEINRNNWKKELADIAKNKLDRKIWINNFIREIKRAKYLARIERVSTKYLNLSLKY